MRTLILICILLETNSFATTFALGGVVGGSNGLSLHIAPSAEVAYHLSGHFSDSDLAVAFDVHRVTPSPWQPVSSGQPLSVYAGLGLSGRNDPEATLGETYHLRLPIGFQWNISQVHVQMFSEICGLIGELPETELAGEVRAGVRAYF